MTAPETGASSVDYSSISGLNALISPGEKEFELITQRLRDLMEEGRGIHNKIHLSLNQKPQTPV